VTGRYAHEAEPGTISTFGKTLFIMIPTCLSPSKPEGNGVRKRWISSLSKRWPTQSTCSFSRILVNVPTCLFLSS